MGSKAEDKKLFILKTAREIFAEKGYKRVTMKDIVEACNISRGGLYLYYGSTDEIFREVLNMESQETDEGFDAAISDDSSVTKIIALFLKEQKKEILEQEKSLAIATYEYYFEKRFPRSDNPLRKTFDDAVLVLSELIAAGIEAGEIYDVDPKSAARNIMFVIEGLKVGALTLDVDSKMVNQQLVYLTSNLIIDGD